jgi:DNA-binding IclR family transcriptional regulator
MSKIVERTLDFIELFAEVKRPLALSDISRLLKVPVSSCYDVLQALQARGYVYELAQRAGYYPTQRLLETARVIAENDPIILRTQAMLTGLREALDETVLLCKTNGRNSVYLLALESSHALRFRRSVGDSIRSLYATSGGKAQLSHWTNQELDDYLKSVRLHALTPKTITSKKILRQQIEAGRKRGWFLNDEESIVGVMTLSAPFVWNTAVYVVTIAGPKARLKPRLKEAAEQLLDACRALDQGRRRKKT